MLDPACTEASASGPKTRGELGIQPHMSIALGHMSQAQSPLQRIQNTIMRFALDPNFLGPAPLDIQAHACPLPPAPLPGPRPLPPPAALETSALPNLRSSQP